MPNRSFVRKAGFMSSLGSVYARFIPGGAGLAGDQGNGESKHHCNRDAARAAGNVGNDRWICLRVARSECYFHRSRGYCYRSEVRRIICTGSGSLYPLAGCDHCAHEVASRSAPGFCSLCRGTSERPGVPVGAGCVPTYGSLVRLSGLGRNARAGSEAKFLDRDRWARTPVANTGKPNESYTAGQRPSSSFRGPTRGSKGYNGDRQTSSSRTAGRHV
jgi:hypothetical protein